MASPGPDYSKLLSLGGSRKLDPEWDPCGVLMVVLLLGVYHPGREIRNEPLPLEGSWLQPYGQGSTELGVFVLSHFPATGTILLKLVMPAQMLKNRQIEILGRFFRMPGGDFVTDFSRC